MKVPFVVVLSTAVAIYVDEPSLASMSGGDKIAVGMSAGGEAWRWTGAGGSFENGDFSAWNRQTYGLDLSRNRLL